MSDHLLIFEIFNPQLIHSGNKEDHEDKEGVVDAKENESEVDDEDDNERDEDHEEEEGEEEDEEDDEEGEEEDEG